MSNQITDHPTGFYPRHAKLLTHRVGDPYSIIRDQHSMQWLVDAVVDNGRLMSLILLGSNGRITKEITSREYCSYSIVLGPFDDEGNEVELDTRFSDVD